MLEHIISDFAKNVRSGRAYSIVSINSEVVLSKMSDFSNNTLSSSSEYALHTECCGINGFPLPYQRKKVERRKLNLGFKYYQ